MLNQPCINPAYLVKTLEPDTVFFISERQSTTIQDPLYYRLVNAIDGECSVDQILDQLQSQKYILNFNILMTELNIDVLAITTNT